MENQNWILLVIAILVGMALYLALTSEKAEPLPTPANNTTVRRRNRNRAGDPILLNIDPQANRRFRTRQASWFHSSSGTNHPFSRAWRRSSSRRRRLAHRTVNSTATNAHLTNRSLQRSGRTDVAASTSRRPSC